MSIQTGYGLFKELLAEFADEQMSIPGVIGEWSVKDVLTHIVLHEQRMIQWTKACLCGDKLTDPQPYDMPDDELVAVNEKIYRENRDRPLDDVLYEFDKAHTEAMSLVETAGEEDLIDPRRFQLRGGEPLWAAIAANTFEHYEEHSRDLRAWRMSR